jgi:hypothetical protein
MVANLFWDSLPGDFSAWGGSINQLANTTVEFDINAPVASPNKNLADEVQEVTQTSTPQIVWKLDFTPAGENAYPAYRVPSLYPGVTLAVLTPSCIQNQLRPTITPKPWLRILWRCMSRQPL